MRDQRPMCVIFDKDRTTVYNAPITMHDQKLTEDQHKSEMRRCAEDLRYFIRRGVEDTTKDTNAILNRSRFFGGVGEPDDGDNGRWMYENGLLPHNKRADQLFRRGMPQTAAAMVMQNALPFLKKPMKDIADAHAKAVILGDPWATFEKKPIDHPYLLPPSTGRVQWRRPNGELMETRSRYVDFRKDGIFIRRPWDDILGFFIE